jgi:hypothetical protein
MKIRLEFFLSKAKDLRTVSRSENLLKNNATYCYIGCKIWGLQFEDIFLKMKKMFQKDAVLLQ